MISGAINPLWILVLSVVFIVIGIAVLRLPAFFVLMVAAVLVGLASALGRTGDHRFVQALPTTMTESGAAMSRIGFPIVMAAVIGMCLMESGAADKIVRRSIAVLGEDRAAFALLFCGFLLSAPVFVDTVFMLMLPLARAMSLRTGRHFLLYVLVICAAAATSNGIVPPAPGPLFVASALKLDLGRVILAGLAFSLVPLAGVYFLARWFDRRMSVPVRATAGSTLESLSAAIARPESELPGFALSIAPVLLPMVLIAAASFLGFTRSHLPARISIMVEFLGEKNVALFLGAFIALIVLVRAKNLPWRKAGQTLQSPLEAAGLIILVIAAGGAYGAMINNAGIGQAVHQIARGHALNFVFLGWLAAAVMRAAQGSATVAAITAAGIITSMAGPAGFGVNPLYILIAVGFGSKFLSWMNDPGFWVICRIGGLTSGETLRSWTILVSLVSLLGLAEVLLLSSFFPHPQF